ncbi:MAG: imidazole glycerol phosphate synthase subunit HisH [Pseudomonadota bacterium]|nr:imidazole glycerol phosphate synthase subunit HisH [Pseudomonadota bacterium]
MMDIAIVDYGMGNLRSVAKAFEKVAPDSRILVTGNAEELLDADRVVFPGVGALGDAMRELESRNLIGALREVAQTRPFLGICLGLQMLFEFSEEGKAKGLGLFPGQVRRFADGMLDAAGLRLKVPHMGWNEVHQLKPHFLWQGIADESRFYFVHSYYVETTQNDLVAATTCYPHPFVSAIAFRNLFAVQFHPEKSQAAGLRLLRNFVLWNGTAG